MGLVEHVLGDAAAHRPREAVVLGGRASRHRDRFVEATHAEQAHGLGPGQLDPRPGRVDRRERVHEGQRLRRAAGPGQETGAADGDGRTDLRIAHAGHGLLVGGEGAGQVTVPDVAGVGQPLGQLGPGGVVELLLPQPRDETLDLREVVAHRLGLDEQGRPLDGGHVTAVGGGAAGARRPGRGPGGQGQLHGLANVVAGHRPTGTDPPQRDPHHVLAPAGAVRLHHVGQLGPQPPLTQRRDLRPEHLPVQRVGEADVGAPAVGDHDDDAARLQGLERRRAVALLEVDQAEALALGEQLEHGEP